MKKIVLGTAAALLLSAGAASAAGINANLSGSYANLSNGGGDVWNIDGAVNTGFGGGWGAELTGGYHNVSSGSADLGNFGGAVFWGDDMVRLAASVNYMDLSVFHLTSYGVAGEWYAMPNLTVSLRGGGASGQFGIDGGYVGGQAKWYVTPDIALDGGVDYINLSGFTHVTSETIRGEWLVSETTPVSLFAGYSHADTGAGGDFDAFFVGIKLYTNDGGSTLVDRQRGGNLGYLDSVPYLGQVF
ncbi:MAG: hypothetical protein JSR60_11965 [Proteobacteria bacterium]|nr:hypothetical protein [Pseudomonadota bacterium]